MLSKEVIAELINNKEMTH